MVRALRVSLDLSFSALLMALIISFVTLYGCQALPYFGDFLMRNIKTPPGVFFFSGCSGLPTFMPPWLCTSIVCTKVSRITSLGMCRTTEWISDFYSRVRESSGTFGSFSMTASSDSSWEPWRPERRLTIEESWDSLSMC